MFPDDVKMNPKFKSISIFLHVAQSHWKRRGDFDDVHPELKVLTRSSAIERCARKVELILLSRNQLLSSTQNRRVNQYN